MMKVQRIYIDNSVIGGYFDPEFAEYSKKLFERNNIKFVVSNITEQELTFAPAKVQTLLMDLNLDFELVIGSNEAYSLADEYISEQVIGKASRNDCIHIAIATIEKVDVLVSWNFKHIVNLSRIRGYNSVNIKNGYGLLEIRSPREVIDNEE